MRFLIRCFGRVCRNTAFGVLALLFTAVIAGCDATDSGAKLKAKPLPDFSKIDDVQQKKAAFFDYMLPMVSAENERILTIRSDLMKIQKASRPLSSSEKKRLLGLAVNYSVNAPEQLTDDQLIAVLLRRIDIVPPSLALAQSANESAWGTSRFARQGNNLFGQWCFAKGCGLVPKARDDGAVHEVAAFKSTRKSVDAYIHNINTGSAYAGLRKLREKQRAEHKPVDGYTLAAGLERYSERGHEYIKEIRAMINFNKLSRYDDQVSLDSKPTARVN